MPGRLLPARCLPRLLTCAWLVSSAAFAEPPRPSTFSIVAADPATGEVGVAVASRFFAVGSVVPYARAGVGAVATQASANTTYGPRGLELLARRRFARRGARHPHARGQRAEPAPGRRRRGDGASRDLHRTGLQRLGRRPQRSGLRRAGQHPHRRGGRRGDGEGVSRERRQAARRAALRGARGRRRGRRRQPRQAVGGAPGRRAPAAATAASTTARSTSASTTTPTRSSSSAGWSTSRWSTTSGTAAGRRSATDKRGEDLKWQEMTLAQGRGDAGRTSSPRCSTTPR